MAPSIEEEYQRKFGKTSMRGELSTPPHAGMAPLMSSVPRPETWPSTFTSTASQPTHPPILATEVQDISAALHRAVLDGTLTRDPVDGESVIRKFGAQEHLTSQQPATTIATMPAITFAAKPTPVNATTPANATMPASATSHETVMLGRVTDDHSKLIQYSPNALNTIGKVCSEQLTPLSTVQAMLPYETQCESKVEKLFRGDLSELARDRTTGLSDSTPLKHLELGVAGVKQLEKDVGNLESAMMGVKDIMVKNLVATSKARADMMQVQLKAAVEKTEAFDDMFANVYSRIEDLKETSNTINAKYAKLGNLSSINAADLAALKASISANISTLKTDNSKIDDRVTDLFVQQRALQQQAQQQATSTSRNDDLIRVMTAQMCHPPTSHSISTSPLLHRVSAQLPGGDTIDIAVPKGCGFVDEGTKKENKSKLLYYRHGKRGANV